MDKTVAKVCAERQDKMLVLQRTMVLAQRDPTKPLGEKKSPTETGLCFLERPWLARQVLSVFFFLLLVAEARTLQDTADLHRQAPCEVTLSPPPPQFR